jgi:2-polyprenyl-3-methyl-5-hydroxy-6-metoxy-1,4-benzoquinol methylase
MYTQNHTSRLSSHDAATGSTTPARVPRLSDEKWEKFAQENPYHYILTSLKSSSTSEFWLSGERTIQREFLPLLELHDVPADLCLELGCGIGRLAVPLARHFKQVAGVDIAPGMIQRATSYARDNGISNVSYAAISGPEDVLHKLQNFAGRCNFIYSLLVFQHIADFSIIDGYLRLIRALLHPRGLAYLQFDTRSQGFAYSVKTRLPDWLLPPLWRRGIRRIRCSPEDIDMSILNAALEIVGELTPHTAYHRYILRLSPSGREGAQ